MIGSSPEGRDTVFGLLFSLSQQPLTIVVGFAITQSRQNCLHLWLPAIGEGLFPLGRSVPRRAIYPFRQGINGPVFLLSLPLLSGRGVILRYPQLAPACCDFCCLFAVFALLRLARPTPYPLSGSLSTPH